MHSVMAHAADTEELLMYSFTALLGPAEARSLGLGLGLPCGWKKHQFLGHCLLPPQVLTGLKLESRAEVGFRPRQSDM